MSSASSPRRGFDALNDTRLCVSVAGAVLLHALVLSLPVSLKQMRPAETLALCCLGIESRPACRLPAPEPLPQAATAAQPQPAPPVQAVRQKRPLPRPVRKPVPEPLPAQPLEPSLVSEATAPPEPSSAPAAAAAGKVSDAVAGGGAQGPFQAVFGALDGPQFLKRVEPQYPLAARRLGQQGRVVLCLTIDERGILRDVQVVEAHSDMFARAAERAVRQSTFRPAHKGGGAVACRALLPFTFKLRS